MLVGSLCEKKSKIIIKEKKRKSKFEKLALLRSRNAEHDNAKSAQKEHSASKI